MEHRASHKGKEGYPTLSYEVTVDHTKRIIAATTGFKGALNDKTVASFVIKNTKFGIEFLTYLQFYLLNNEGGPQFYHLWLL